MESLIWRIFIGLLLSAFVGGLAYWRRSLTIGGWLGAVITGTATFGFGGWIWGVLLVCFFVSSSLLSHYKEAIKEARAGEKFDKSGRRDFAQVMANGGIASLLALLYAFDQSTALFFAYIGVLATVTADTWATELGVLSTKTPRLIMTWQPVDAGTSGGITATGTLAASAGGFFIGAVAFLMTLIDNMTLQPSIMMPVIGVCSGLAGALFDSILGATVQAIYIDTKNRYTERKVDSQGRSHRLARGWTWMTNDAVNFLSSLFGGTIAILLWIFLS